MEDEKTSRSKTHSLLKNKKQNMFAFENNLESTRGSIKLWFTNMYFVGFYSVPNLIVIIFNLLYLVFIVGFDCKGCVLERECVKTQAIEARRVLNSF